MAITNYVRPQLTIQQILTQTDTSPVDRINAVVVGPQYLLSRYGQETLTPSVEFDSAGQEIAYKFYNGNTETALTSGYVVDTDSVKVFGVGLEAVLATIGTGATNKLYVDDLTKSNIVRIASVNFSGGSIEPLLLGRAVQVGDLMYVDDGITAEKRRKVVALIGKDVAATYGANTDGDDSEIAPSGLNPGETAANTLTAATASHADVDVLPASVTSITKTGTFDGYEQGSLVNGLFGEEYIVTCTTAGAPGTAQVSIATTSGNFSATGVTLSDAAGDYQSNNAAFGGCTITFAEAASMQVGDVIKFRIYGDYHVLADSSEISVGDTGSGYTGPRDTTYRIQVTTGVDLTDGAANGADSAVVKITDSNGVDTIQTGVDVTEDTWFSVGSYGLRAKFTLANSDHEGIRKGDTFYVHAKAATQSTTEFNKVKLDGPAVDTSVFVNPATAIAGEFRLAFTGEIASTDASDGTAWVANATDITLDASLALYLSTRSAGNEWVSYKDAIGDIFYSYRALIPPASGETYFKVTATTRETLVGKEDLDNDLGYACAEALRGSQGKDIYAIRVGGTDSTAYEAALAKLQNNDMLYALAILSGDTTVQSAVVTHVEAMSTQERKNFRRAYVPTESPGVWARLRNTVTPYTATITDLDGDNNLVTFTTAGVDLTTLNIKAGDTVKFPSEDTEYTIVAVLSTTELQISGGPDAPVSPASAAEVWAADTAANTAEFVSNTSAALSSRRVTNVWCEGGTRIVNGSTTAIPVRYMVAHVAGLRSAVLPQQGLTRTEVTTISNAAAMHTRYTQELLDSIADDGTFIITQNAEGGSVYIRHQLTTETAEGSLAYEDGVGVNFDDISFQIKDALDDKIGKKNVTPQTIAEIRAELQDLLESATQTDFDIGVGPQLIRFADLKVGADPILKDRINASATLYLPLPLNDIAVVLNASVDVTL